MDVRVKVVAKVCVVGNPVGDGYMEVMALVGQQFEVLWHCMVHATEVGKSFVKWGCTRDDVVKGVC